MMDITIPYYEDLTRISNSNIGWFLNKGPSYLHSMLVGTGKGESGPQLEKGTMIHEYLLQPEEFTKNYLVWNKCRPSSTQQEAFCQALAKSIEIEPNKAILDAYKSSYRTTNKSDDKVLSEGLKIALELKDYIDFIKSNDKRILISDYQSNQLMRIAENIHSHKKANELLKNPYKNDIEELNHEFHINWEYYDDNCLIKCKSLLDSVYIDYKNHKVIIMDLKTTAKLWHFEDSINTYDYLRQLCYYTMAVNWYLIHEKSIYEKIHNWSYEWYIIGIDSIGSNEIRTFQFTKEQVESKKDIITTALKDISWHKSNNLWEHSKDYYENDGAEKLNLNINIE